MVHEVQVVDVLQDEPVALELLVLAEVYTLSHCIEFVQRLLLEVVAIVGAEILRFACPCERVKRRISAPTMATTSNKRR